MPTDYGSDFSELKEEDRDRVQHLNHLVANFMDQYNHSSLSFEDFMGGPWVAQMERLEADEKDIGWTVEKREILLSIGVMPKDTTESTESPSVAEDDKQDEDEEPSDADIYPPEYWRKIFETIANGDDSAEEMKWRQDLLSSATDTEDAHTN
ncbi:hypothetical protein NUW58_g137 [Xylaria curta]|uniref:Uncharacterized protein n=1 Tax=Xylaria curta TaxID=42375 RepID=A0ACC1PSC6_9PEZI|nr:hypothetical protein NUW58_g137 [Xylaria curta]